MSGTLPGGCAVAAAALTIDMVVGCFMAALAVHVAVMIDDEMPPVGDNMAI